jgi:2-phospho-L-lactate guanylyltransferase
MPDMSALAGRPCPAGQTRWAIVVPVKRLADAKTRILVERDVRIELALAMAADTVGAALACPLVEVVIAVSDDEHATSVLRTLGAVVVPDSPDAGLNPALVHGASVSEVPGGVGVAAIAADLPALRPHELADVLTAASRHGVVVVADAGGDGTTLLAAADPERFRPAFGVNSRARHVAAGAVDLTDSAGPSLRTDVDTLADLDAAAALGLGPATEAAVHRRQLA